MMKSIAAYLFYVWDAGQEDQNRELTKQEVDYYHSLARKLIEATYDIKDHLLKNEDTQFYLYEVGKKYFGTEKHELLLFFKCLYTIFFGYSNGPRIGVFIDIFGKENFLKKLEIRMNNPFGFSFNN